MADFRELSLDEIASVAGGYYSSDGGPWVWGGDGSGGGSTGGGTNPPEPPSLGTDALVDYSVTPEVLTYDQATASADWVSSYPQESGGGFSSIDDASGYFLNEMCTGDWDWAQQNYLSDHESAIVQDLNTILHNAPNASSGINGIVSYLNDIGLGALTQGPVDHSYNAGNAYHGSSSNGDIIVYAPWQQYTPQISGILNTSDHAALIFDPSSGGNSSSGSVGTGYSTPGTTAAANDFADSHVKNMGSTADDVAAAHQAHDNLAKWFDFAAQNPNSPVYIGNNQAITAPQALDAFSHIVFRIVDTGGGVSGGETSFNPATGRAVVDYNPAKASGYLSSFGIGGTNYVMFHELGHVINGIYNFSKLGDEAAANSAGRSLENSLGITLMSAPPRGGYD